MQCTEKYYEAYENGVRSDAEHLRFGTMMHTVFERWFQEDKEIEEIFSEEWAKGEVVSPTLFNEAHDIMEIFKSKNDRNTITPIGFELAFAINILTGEAYDCDGVNWSNSVERKAFMKKLEEDEDPIIFGYIDRVDLVIEEDMIRIKDYKTSRIALTQYEANEDVQLSMYGLVARYLFPEYKKVSLELEYVRFGIDVKTTRTDAQLDLFKEWLISMYYLIKEDKQPKATLNKYCGWCDSKKGCYAYQELIHGEAEDVDVDSLEYDRLDNELEKVNVHIKVLSDRKKEIEKLFKDKLRDTDNSPINTGGAERYVTPNIRTSYDINTIIELFPDSLNELLSVSKTNVDKLAKGNEEVQRALEETSSNYFISPTLRRKKLNK
jgi:hypothetical protein